MYLNDKISVTRNYKSFLNRFLIILFWLIGLLSSLYFTLETTAFSSALMRSVTEDRLSIIGLFLMLTFPFLISAVLLRFTRPLWILPVVFFKAFIYSCCLYGLTFAYGDAGWLVRWLLLFSDSCVVVLLLWFWLRNASGDLVTYKSDLLLCCFLSVLIIGVDYYIVSPISVILY